MLEVVVRSWSGELVLERKCSGWLMLWDVMGALYRRREVWPARGAAGCAVAWDTGLGARRGDGEASQSKGIGLAQLYWVEEAMVAIDSDLISERLAKMEAEVEAMGWCC